MTSLLRVEKGGLTRYGPESEGERNEVAWLGVCSLYFRIIKDNSNDQSLDLFIEDLDIISNNNLKARSHIETELNYPVLRP